MNSENKQFVAVSIFLLVIVLTIAALATSSLSNKKRKDYSVTPVAVNSNSPIPKVKKSENITIVTSNTNVTPQTSNNNNYNNKKSNTTITHVTSNSNKTNNTNNSSNSSGKKIIPVSYFITSVDDNTVYVGGSTNIYVTIKPDNATYKNVTYSSSNTSVAKVNKYGKIIGINPGKCTITIVVNGAGKSSFDFKVVKKPNDAKPDDSSDRFIDVEGVSLNVNSINLNVNDTYNLKANILPANATNKTVSWTSSDTSVVSVTNAGHITAKKVGKATITVKASNGKKSTCTVTVTKRVTSVKVKGVSLNRSFVTIKNGEKLKLVATVSPSNATNKSISWTSNDYSVAHVLSDGTVVGRKVGSATIKATTVDGSKTASCIITVLPNTIPVTGITLNKTSLSLHTGEGAYLYATVLPSNATNKEITWSSSNNNVSVNNSGYVTAKSVGTSTVYAKTKDGSKVASCKVTITKATVKVTGVKLNRSSVSINVGATTQLTATISPSNATNKGVTWTSSNTSVATVSSNGVITGKKAGTANITVKTNDGGKTATCKVTINALKNGWKTEGGKDYYYVNGKKLTNQFKDYRYLGKDGAALAKMGSFNITIYKSTAWVAANQLNIYEKDSTSSKYLGYAIAGDKVTILSGESNGMVKIHLNKTTGYVSADYLFINLPDVMPRMSYVIPAASSKGLTMTSGGYKIPGITGRKYYKFSKAYNAKIERNEYYAPFLYPAAKKLQSALNKAWSQGYSFKVYDTYRPTWVEKDEYEQYMKLYNTNAKVRAAINKTVNGFKYNLSWFMTTGASRHCQGHAIDLALTDKNGKELKAQCPVDTLDTSAVIEYNNSVSNKLKSFLTGVGFTSLRSEWWHYDLRNTNYAYRGYYNFNIFN